MRKIYFAAALVASSLAFAQTEGKVGLNTSTPEATLEIKPSATNAATSATTKEGILIPRVSRLRASNMGMDVTESTMVYISDVSDGSASGTTADVDAKGFYYFDGNKWVKMKGAGGGSGTVNHASLFVGIKKVANVVAADFTDTVNTVVFTGTTHTIPDPAGFQNKVIVLVNNSGGNVTLSVDGGSAVFPESAVKRRTAVMYVSDGTNWYRFAN